MHIFNQVHIQSYYGGIVTAYKNRDIISFIDQKLIENFNIRPTPFLSEHNSFLADPIQSVWSRKQSDISLVNREMSRKVCNLLLTVFVEFFK